MADEDKIQQQYLQFQQVQQQLEMIAQHLQLLNQQIVELDISISAVQEIETTAVDQEILAPLANGIFVKAILKDNQKMVVNVGSNVTVEKTIPEVIKLLEEQKKEILKRIVETEQIGSELQQQATQIFQEVEQEQQKAEK